MAKFYHAMTNGGYNRQTQAIVQRKNASLQIMKPIFEEPDLNDYEI